MILKVVKTLIAFIFLIRLSTSRDVSTPRKIEKNVNASVSFPNISLQEKEKEGVSILLLTC